jgi:formylglycine-generating enzyme required for sulfatase activity
VTDEAGQVQPECQPQEGAGKELKGGKRKIRKALLLVVLLSFVAAIVAVFKAIDLNTFIRIPPRFYETGGLKVPKGFQLKPGATAEPYTNTGWAKEVVHEKTGVEMVFIPAGEFEMGSNDGEGEEKPVHRVRITHPFYMGKCEVTQGQWQRLMGNNPSNFKGVDRLPVEGVSWYDCQEFLKKAGEGLKLPTEAQWEYACRAGTKTQYSFGNGEGQLGKYAWYGGNSGEMTHPVGEKSPNAWGLYDMHGNVWEWCADGFDGNYYSNSPAEDPKGPHWKQERVVRGGSWINIIAGYCRSAGRTGVRPDYSSTGGGFRPVKGL